MQPDDLNKPLVGRTPPPGSGGSSAIARGAPWGRIAAGGLGVLALLLIAFAWITDDGMGGEPFAVARIETVRPAPTPVADARAPAAQVASASADPAAGVTVRAGEPPEPNASKSPGRVAAPGAPLIINVQEALELSLSEPDVKLSENTRHGVAPRIGPDGARPMDVYARPQATGAGVKPGAPRIAIVIGGMGLNQELTQQAIAELPGAVTLGFAPYGPELQRQTAQARGDGHEILLQAPMEGFGGAAQEPGPHVLRTADDTAAARDKLLWHMTRFPGFVGVAGFLGAKFTADAAAFQPVLSEVANRGLFYFDDATSTRSLAPTLAARASTPFARADVVLDARLDAVDDALLRLEAQARLKGAAIGVASGLPIVVEKVSRFARGLDKKGLALVPLSALVAVPSANTARSDR